MRYGGTIPDDAYFGEDKDEKMETFDIKTSAADASNQVKKKEIQEAIKVSASDTTAATKYLAQSHKDVLSSRLDILGKSDSTLHKSAISIKTNKEDQENLNNQYVMGYFDWYWKKYGFFKTFMNFFAKKMVNDIIYSIFYNGGMAIGSYWMVKHGLPKFANWIKFPLLIDSQF